MSPLMTSIFTKYTQRGSQRWKEYSWEEHVVIAGRAACPSDLPHLVAMQAHEVRAIDSPKGSAKPASCGCM